MTISVRLGKEMEEMLTKLSKVSNLPKSYFVREAVRDKMEDLEDVYYALTRRNEIGETTSLDDLLEDEGLVEN